jgi:hypothetical protein
MIIVRFCSTNVRYGIDDKPQQAEYLAREDARSLFRMIINKNALKIYSKSPLNCKYADINLHPIAKNGLSNEQNL